MLAGFVTFMGLVVGSEECVGVCKGRVFFVPEGLCDSIYARSCGPLQWGLAVLSPR